MATTLAAQAATEYPHTMARKSPHMPEQPVAVVPGSLADDSGAEVLPRPAAEGHTVEETAQGGAQGVIARCMEGTLRVIKKAKPDHAHMCALDDAVDYEEQMTVHGNAGGEGTPTKVADQEEDTFDGLEDIPDVDAFPKRQLEFLDIGALDSEFPPLSIPFLADDAPVRRKRARNGFSKAHTRPTPMHREQETGAAATHATDQSFSEETVAMAVETAAESPSQETSSAADATAHSPGKAVAAVLVDDAAEGRIGMAQVPQLIEKTKCSKPLLFLLVVTRLFAVTKEAGELFVTVDNPSDFVHALDLVGKKDYARENTNKTRNAPPEVLARDNNPDFQTWSLMLKFFGKTAGAYKPAWGPKPGKGCKNEWAFRDMVTQNLSHGGIRASGKLPPGSENKQYGFGWADYKRTSVKIWKVHLIRSDKSPDVAAEYDRLFACTPESALRMHA